MQRSYSVGTNGVIELNVDNISPRYTPEDLFTMGLRSNNPKRSFLFVSKVLGKHIPIKTDTLFNALDDLVEIWAENCFQKKVEELHVPVLVIGFAETATAMGHGFFSKLNCNAMYLHSTRETPENIESLFYACESHSHAVDHNFFLENRSFIEKVQHIVIVDDEITTGNTALNLIRAIDEKYPGKEYSAATFLDWRDNSHREVYRTGIGGKEIGTASLLEGNIRTNTLISPEDHSGTTWGAPSLSPEKWKTVNLDFTQSGFSDGERTFVRGSGRFGIDCDDQVKLDNEIEMAGDEIRKLRRGKKTLFLGQGECMYIPLRLAGEAGENVFFHATTRSPAWPTEHITPYGIKSGISFKALHGEAHQEYLYNILNQGYDEFFLVTEYNCDRSRLESFTALINGAGIKDIKHIVIGK